MVGRRDARLGHAARTAIRPKVVQAWLKSPEHRAIMLSSRYHLVGIGRAYGTFLGHPGASVWTVDWGHR